MLKDAIKRAGGCRVFARKHGLNENTVASWVHRDAVPARVLLNNKSVVRALTRAGWMRKIETPNALAQRTGAEGDRSGAA